MTAKLHPPKAVPAPRGKLQHPQQTRRGDVEHGAQAEPDVPGPRDANQPAHSAPEGPSTSYEYPRVDRGAAATEHERQVRESLAGPSRDDAARGK